MRSDALREAEKFMIVGAGNAVCANCSYEYLQENGDKDFPVPAGTPFEVSLRVSQGRPATEEPGSVGPVSSVTLRFTSRVPLRA